MSHYFDFNAGCRMRPEVIDFVAELLGNDCGNPSSMHSPGRRARALLEEARDSTAVLFGVAPDEVIFTSGGTESNNTALRGAMALDPALQLLVSSSEHASISAVADYLEEHGRQVRRFTVDAAGQLDLELIGRASKEARSLLALSLANGDTGHLLELDKICSLLAPATSFHLDLAQAVGRIALRLPAEVTTAAASCHKYGGPLGCGVLIKRGTELEPLMAGGGQERGVRAGTENIAAIAGAGLAARLALAQLDEEASRLKGLASLLWSLIGDLPSIRLLSPEDGLPGTLTVALGDVPADVMIAGLDLEGFAVSSGSACEAGSPEPPATAVALGLEAPWIHGVIRMSMGWENSRDDVLALGSSFNAVAGKARMAA
ncbi:MAG TPA: aminotransferase class V-fold PLP-dependent enzyme [Deltaproteobacteria bacterium]|nr:aminotransferase class V-fold PLP-dependent enzyme [Candidatus Binatota bacterium]HIL13879.1 aminotransferase class V-fold PLP-dependent enzyme [Deltaproteobacteria bacterium]